MEWPKLKHLVYSNEHCLSDYNNNHMKAGEVRKRKKIIKKDWVRVRETKRWERERERGEIDWATERGRLYYDHYFSHHNIVPVINIRVNIITSPTSTTINCNLTLRFHLTTPPPIHQSSPARPLTSPELVSITTVTIHITTASTITTVANTLTENYYHDYFLRRPPPPILLPRLLSTTTTTTTNTTTTTITIIATMLRFTSPTPSTSLRFNSYPPSLPSLPRIQQQQQQQQRH